MARKHQPKKPASAARLRTDAEAALATGPPPAAAAPDGNDALLHELQVHQIELEMQNEALRQSQAELEATRDRYVHLFEFAPAGYLTLDANGLISAVNLPGAALLGVDRKKLLRRRFARFILPADRDRWSSHFIQARRHRLKQSCELRLQRGDNTIFHAGMDFVVVSDDTGVPALHVTLTDISERRRADDELRIAAIAFESQEGMMVTDAKGVILRVNHAFTNLTGYLPEEAVGRTPALLRSGRQDREFYERMWQALIEKGYWQGEIWNFHKDGSLFAEWLTISAVKSPDGTTTHYVGAFSEITKHKEAEAEIHRLAYYDTLTGLPNRRLLYDRISRAQFSSDRSRNYGALLFLDLDNFKNLNDTLGHEYGDRLLTEMALRISGAVRTGDTVARIGGDEFVVMLENLSAETQEAAIQTRAVGEKINEAANLPCELDGREIHCGASIGVTLFRGHEEPIDTLLKHADLAMYQAKNGGRNTLRFFDHSMQSAVNRRSALEGDLREALKQGQFYLVFQPQVDFGGHVTGAEVLLRWTHKVRGEVAPNDFIPLSEETGLILPIGRWVLDAACTQIKEWSKLTGMRDLRLAVNVSARQFRQTDFVAQLTRALELSGANPARLKIELTESLVIDDVAETIARMEQLKALGVTFSIDDFGTGFSSLSYLKRLPLDQFKIDYVFIRDLATDLNNAAIVRTIITMGKTLGLDVIAEGVETAEQLVLLKEYGCASYQGYLFARPLQLAAFERFVARQNSNSPPQWDGGPILM